MREIRQALADGDAKGVQLAAHALKGSLRIFGPSCASELAYKLEQMGDKGVLEGGDASIAELDSELARLLHILADGPPGPSEA